MFNQLDRRLGVRCNDLPDPGVAENYVGRLIHRVLDRPLAVAATSHDDGLTGSEVARLAALADRQAATDTETSVFLRVQFQQQGVERIASRSENDALHVENLSAVQLGRGRIRPQVRIE